MPSAFVDFEDGESVEVFFDGKISDDQIAQLGIEKRQLQDRLDVLQRPQDTALQNALENSRLALGRLASNFRQFAGSIDEPTLSVVQSSREQQQGLAPGSLPRQIGQGPRSPDEERQLQETIANLQARNFQERPFSTFGGMIAPEMALPGGRLTQAGIGAAEGFLEGEGAAGRAGGAATGFAMGLVGQKVGDIISARAQRGLQHLFRANRNVDALDVLASNRIPTTPAQRAGDFRIPFLGKPFKATAQFFDNLSQTVSGTQPLRADQIRRLNRIGAEAIGENADNLGSRVLTRAARRLEDVYEGVANRVDTVLFPSQASDDLSAISTKIEDFGVDSPKVKRTMETIVRDFNRGMSGKRFMELRRMLSKLSSELGNSTDGDVVREIRQVLDDALLASAPDAADDLVSANQQWQMLELFRSPNVVDPTGEINTRSMAAAVRRFFPGADIGRVPNPRASNVVESLQALRQVAPGTASQPTSIAQQRILPLLLAGAGLGGATGGGGGAVAGALLAPRLATAGGGIGGLLGGSAARATIPSTLSLLRMSENQR